MRETKMLSCGKPIISQINMYFEIIYAVIAKGHINQI